MMDCRKRPLLKQYQVLKSPLKSENVLHAPNNPLPISEGGFVIPSGGQSCPPEHTGVSLGGNNYFTLCLPTPFNKGKLGYTDKHGVNSITENYSRNYIKSQYPYSKKKLHFDPKRQVDNLRFNNGNGMMSQPLNYNGTGIKVPSNPPRVVSDRASTYYYSDIPQDYFEHGIPNENGVISRKGVWKNTRKELQKTGYYDPSIY